MSESRDQLIQEIKDIKSQWENEVGPSGRKVWPKAIKQRIFRLIDQKVPRRDIAQKTGVPYETINVWVHKGLKRKALTAQSFHPISVKNEIATVTVPYPPKNEITFKTPKGYEIHGLGVSEILAIIKQIGRL